MSSCHVSYVIMSSCRQVFIGLLEPLRVDGLHLTSIRNENAYYSCVKMLVDLHKLPIDFSLPILHVAGDSHCFPLAWQTLSYKVTTLLPILFSFNHRLD